MRRVFRLVDTAKLSPAGTRATKGFNLSVERNGVITPIIVAETTADGDESTLEIVDGNRRVRAAKFAKISKVPAVVLMETSEEERGRLTLISNHLRSSNFLTESSALSSLVSTRRETLSIAFALGLAPSKVQKMFDKLEAMPAEVRSAMCEGRIPVSSATAIAGWPEQVQDEVVALLRERHHVQTWAIKAIKEKYDDAHRPVQPVTSVHSVVAPAHGEWTNQAPVAFESPSIETKRAQPTAAAEVSGLIGPVRPANVDDRSPASLPERSSISSVPTVDVSERLEEPRAVGEIVPVSESPSPEDSAVTGTAETVHATAPEHVASTEPVEAVDLPTSDPSSAPETPAVEPAPDAPPAASTAADPAVEAAADRARQLRAFVTSLDAGLLELANKTRDEQLGRDVWIDRALRAWDIAMAE